MRLNFATDEGGTAAGSPRIGEGEPLPPDDRIANRALSVRLSIDALYRSQAPRLLRFFARRTGQDDALDLVHETFERLARRDEAAAPGVDRPEAYLTSIAGNLLRDRAKFAVRRAAAFHVPLDDLPLIGSDPHDQLEARDVINRLELAMQRLRPRTREIFMACRLDGYSHAQIAERVGMSVRGVRKEMGRAIAEIDRVLGEE